MNNLWKTDEFSRRTDLLRNDLSPPEALIAPVEVAPIAEIRALQLDRLQKIVAHAYENTPFYRKKYQQAGVKPSDIKSLEDIRLLPFTTKADLRDNYPFDMFAVPMDQVQRIHASSGTTGKPTVVGYTKQDIEVWSEVVARSMIAAGVRPGDIVHNAYGYGLFTGGLGAHYGAEKLGCTVIPMSGGQTARQVQLINDFRPRVITVTPSYMFAIADEFRRQGLDPAECSLEIGIFGAEPWTDATRREIEKVFNIRAVDIYGLSEIVGPGVSNECVESQDGLYIWEDHFYPEIIDPNTDTVLPDGAEGELIFTTLSKFAMPVIRYRTKDLTKLLSGKARSMRRMAKVTGRSDDMMILRGVNVFPTQLEEQILTIPELSPHFEIRLFCDGHMDGMELKVEARNENWSSLLSGELCEKVKNMVGVTVQVSIFPPNTIARSQGKIKRIFDER